MKNLLSKTYTSRIAIGVLSIVSLWGLIDAWDGYGAGRIAKFVLISVAQALALYYFTKSRYRIVRLCAHISIVLIYALSIVSLYCYHYWNFGIGGRLYIFITETNAEEAKGFVSTMINLLPSLLTSWHLWGMLLAIAVCIAALWRIPQKIYNIGALTLLCLGIGCAIYHVATTRTSIGKESGKKNISILLRSAHDFWYTIQQLRTYAKLTNDIDIATLDTATIASAHNAERVILMLGESSNCKHWSLYGYQLPTTPHLDLLRDSLIICSDVVPAYGTTASSLPNVLSIRNTSENRAKWYTYGTIIGIAQKAKYKVHWISNQWYKENILTLIASEADNVQYVKKQHYCDYGRLVLDEEMLPMLTDALCDTFPSQFIIMHCAGSHFEYDTMYPPQFNKFSASDIPSNDRNLSDSQKTMISHYDNAILYTDTIIASAISLLQADSTHSTLLIYVSDHSEDVYDTSTDYYGHATKPNQQIHVPMIIWANDKYKQQNPTIWNNLQSNANKAYSSENLIYTIMGATGTTYKWYNAQQDLSSDSFRVQHRYFEEKLWD